MVGRRARRSIAAAAVGIAVVAVAACGSNTGSDASASSASSASGNGTYTIKWSVGQSESDVVSVAARQFQSAVEKQTGNHVKVDLYYTGQLGSNQAVLADALSGSIQMVTSDPNFLVQYFPSAAFSDLPYIFTSENQAYQFWDGSVGAQEKSAIQSATGLRSLAAMSFGLHSMWSSKGPINSADTEKGLKVESTASAVYLNLWKYLGLQTVELNLSDIFTAAQQGVIQAADLSPSSGYALNLQQVLKYYSDTNDNFSTALTMVSNKFWNTLPAADQKIITTEAGKIQASERTAESAEEAKDLQLMKQAGMTITNVTPQQRASLKAAVGPYYQQVSSLFGPDAAQWLTEWGKQSGQSF
jgi:TRAP-type transport system periplasmic protein